MKYAKYFPHLREKGRKKDCFSCFSPFLVVIMAYRTEEISPNDMCIYTHMQTFSVSRLGDVHSRHTICSQSIFTVGAGRGKIRGRGSRNVRWKSTTPEQWSQTVSCTTTLRLHPCPSDPASNHRLSYKVDLPAQFRKTNFNLNNRYTYL